MLTKDQLDVGASVPSERGPALWWLLLVIAAFLLLYFLVPSSESGDTLRYAGDIVNHAHGNAAQFWEFGHLR